MKQIFLLGIVILLGGNVLAQSGKSVGIGTINPDSAAILHLEATDQGFLMPQMNTLQLQSILSPPNGLIVYNTDDSCYWYFRGNAWKDICSTDTLYSNLIVSDTIFSNTGGFNTIYVTMANIDSIYAIWAQIDSVFVNSGTFNTIFTNWIQSDTIYAIWAYLDTVVSNQITTNTVYSVYGTIDTLFSDVITTDSLYIGGADIYTIINDSIESKAWLLKGNSGTNSTDNYLGTRDSVDLVLRTDSIERIRVTADGMVGVATVPTATLDLNGTFRYRNAPSFNYILTSDSIGNATWQDATVVLADTLLSISNNLDSLDSNITVINNNVAVLDSTVLRKWDLAGNAGTVAGTDFLGTTDSVDFVVKTNSLERYRIKANGALLYSDTLGTTPVSGAGIRMMWIPGKKAFRSGKVTGTEWDDANIGEFSFGTGLNVTALGGRSVAMGNGSYAGGPDNVVMGLNDTANGTANIVMGNESRADGLYSMAFGWRCKTYSNTSLTMGYRCTTMVAANASVNIGWLSTISGTGGGYSFGAGNAISGSGIGSAYGSDAVISGPGYAFGQSINITNGGGFYSFGFGDDQTITGEQVYAYGANVTATHDRSMTFGNNVFGTVSTGADNIVFHTVGATEMYSNGIMTTGVRLAPGAGSWASVSDRNLKENFTDLNMELMLNKYMNIKIQSWNYISQGPNDTLGLYEVGIPHIGPMAQDYYGAFGLGVSDKYITTLDMAGVNMAIIQELLRRDEEREKRMMEIEAELEELKKLMEGK